MSDGKSRKRRVERTLLTRQNGSRRHAFQHRVYRRRRRQMGVVHPFPGRYPGARAIDEGTHRQRWVHLELALERIDRRQGRHRRALASSIRQLRDIERIAMDLKSRPACDVHCLGRRGQQDGRADQRRHDKRGDQERTRQAPPIGVERTVQECDQHEREWKRDSEILRKCRRR